jgi:hypothetical protein
MKAWLLAALTLAHACGVDAAAIATGRNWRLAIDSIECEPAPALLTIGVRIGYLGPKGPVEAPLSQLVDANGKPHLPRSLVWQRGSKPLAAWLSAGGLSNLQSQSVAEVQLKFDLRDAQGELQLEFGDIRAFALTRKGSAGCEGLLRPEQLRAPRTMRAAGAEPAKPGMRIYRNRYLCTQASGTPRSVEASYPPYPPRQLLLFGRGYLPNAREIELPMGKAPAQPYFYSGLDELNAVEDAARRTISADFPQYAGGAHFAFNWGVQKAASGNEMYSVGIYPIGACPPQK